MSDVSPEVEVSAPVDAEPEAPEVESTDAVGSPSAPEAPDPFEPFGGREYVERAHNLYKSTESTDGIIQLFLEAGQNLGLTPQQIGSLFGSNQEDAEPEDLDRPMTVAEFREAQQRQEHAYQQQVYQQAAQTASQTIHSELSKLGIEPGTPEAQSILALGDRYLNRGDLDPGRVAQAVARGHADYVASIEKQANQLLAKKAETMKTVPGSPKGPGAPPAPLPEEPKNVADAIRIARERGYFQ